MRVRWWRAVLLCGCLLVLRSDALPPATLGEVVANAATSLNSMKVRFFKTICYVNEELRNDVILRIKCRSW